MFFMQFSKQPISVSIGLIASFVLVIFLVVTSKKKLTTRVIAQVAIAVALATILQFIKIIHLPQGGSVTLGSMLPIILIAVFYGPSVGCLSGLIYGLINLLVDPYVVHPIQLLLDYPLAYMALGAAGIFKGKFNTLNKVFAVILACAARFVFHFISGIVFFGSYAPKGQPVWLYSLIYNGSFMGVEAIIGAVIFAILPIKLIASQVLQRTNWVAGGKWG